MNTRTKEAIRYLGYGNHAVDDQTFALIEDSLEELDQVADPKIIYRIFDVSHERDNQIRIGGLCIKSRGLARNMKGCGQAVMLGATLGIGVDMMMRRYSLTDMTRTVVMQACGAAILEEYLDEWQEQMAGELLVKQQYLRPRFSPGYGDFDIGHQSMILQMINAAKTIGLTMTDSCMLTPTKSVTAVIGISTVKEPCHQKGCEACGKKDCIYRR